VEGAFGVCFVFADQPDLLIGARRGSPLLVGVGDGEYFLASDASAILEHTKTTVEYLNESELVVLSRAGYVISSLDVSTPVTREHVLHKLEMSLEAIEKGGYKHFMLKEIMEQPVALTNAMRGRVNAETGEVRLGGLLGEPLKRLARARRIIIAACGTSFHSGLVGEYAIESLARVPWRSSRGRARVRVPLPQTHHPVCRRRARRHLAVGRDSRHAGGGARGQGARRAHAGHRQHGGLVHRARDGRGRVRTCTWAPRSASRPPRPSRARCCC
jgi:hypothetical protein